VFRLLSDSHSLPLVAFSFLPLPSGAPRPYDEFQLADKLRERGWVLPAYRMAPAAAHVQLLRAVIREDMSMSMADALLKDIKHALSYLEHHFGGGVSAAAVSAVAEQAPAAASEAAPEEAGVVPPSPSAVPSSAALAFREEHTPHRVHRGHKKHPGVC
jgi:glutamate decarboxylase